MTHTPHGAGASVAQTYLAATGPYLLPSVAATVAFSAGDVGRMTLVAVTGAALSCAWTRGVVEYVRGVGAGDAVDRWIVQGTGAPPPDDVLSSRRDALVTRRMRGEVARTLCRVAADAESRGRPVTPAQRNRCALRRHATELRRIAHLLDDPSRSVPPRAVAQTRLLVTCAGGPLYRSARSGELPIVLNRIVRALEEGEAPSLAPDRLP